ncbi:arylesterase [Rhizorhabdus argentea]|uniref:arylesterase n=1 Tax=Rhizorhabdus argentea TaxID=1387174 RepID=UPI0030ED03F7
MSAPVILALGDSLTAGYGLATFQSFAAQLETALQPTHRGARVTNAGVSGDTTTAALKRLPRELGRLKAKPDLAIVQLGANDLIRGIPLTVTRVNLDTIIAELIRIDIPVLLATMEAPAILGAFGRAYATMYADLAAKHRIPATPFFPSGVLANPSLCLRDGIHPNALGIAAVTRAFLPVVIAALESGGAAGRASAPDRRSASR